MEEVKKLLQSAKDTAIEYGGIAKLHAKIKTEEVKKQEIYYKLGKKYYELYNDTPEKDLKDLVDKLVACDEKIAAYREELNNPKGDEFTEVEPEFTEGTPEEVNKSVEVEADQASDETTATCDTCCTAEEIDSKAEADETLTEEAEEEVDEAKEATENEATEDEQATGEEAASDESEEPKDEKTTEEHLNQAAENIANKVEKGINEFANVAEKVADEAVGVTSKIFSSIAKKLDDTTKKD